nr:uncharacterized protein LOC107422390 [Ziziphus jujuba var. spinosa]
MALFWDSKWKWSVTLANSWFIGGRVDSAQMDSWMIWFCHCLAERSIRRAFWEALTAQVKSGLESWICVGNFNDVYEQNEKLGGVLHLSSATSYHIPIQIKLSFDVSSKDRPFRFLEIWTKDITCRDVVETAWRSADTRDRPTSIRYKLRSTAIALRQWNKNVFGDKNTKFFHAAIIANWRKIVIPALKDGHGIWRESREDIGELLTEDFTKLFKAADIRRTERMGEFIQNYVTSADNLFLEAIMPESEIWNLVQKMHPRKAPGLDGMSAIFFQKYWSIVGPDVVHMAQNVF